MRIFIGSSGESVKSGVLNKLVDIITNAGYEALPWTTPGLFPPGENTYNALRTITHSVDAAIFLFSEDDKVWYRKDSTSIPRDNVLIEYGLFSSALDPRRAIICRTGSPKFASDIAGLTYIDLKDLKRGKKELEIWLNSLRLYYQSIDYKLSIYDNKYKVPGANQFWRDLSGKAKKRFHLLGETNKSWIGRDTLQTEQLGNSIFEILLSDGEVSIYCVKRKSIIEKHRRFFKKYIFDKTNELKSSEKAKYIENLNRNFRFCYGAVLKYQAVISDDRIVIVPLVNTPIFKEESIVFEMHDSKHSRLFQFYSDDIYRTLERSSNVDEKQRLIAYV